MKKLPMVARILLGLAFLIAGTNGLFHFFPDMAPPPGAAGDFVNGLKAAGYFLPFMFLVQAVCGALLLIGAMVPLALIMLAPILTNILLFHMFLDRKGLPVALVLCGLGIYLGFFAEPYSPIIKQIFRCPWKESMDAKKAA
jgi:uncharacterized membrane protein YphA (DoxX/SURF4 family)